MNATPKHPIDPDQPGAHSAAPSGSEMARELGDANAMVGNAMTGLNMRGEHDTPLMRDLMESTKIIEAVRLRLLSPNNQAQTPPT